VALLPPVEADRRRGSGASAAKDRAGPRVFVPHLEGRTKNAEKKSRLQDSHNRRPLSRYVPKRRDGFTRGQIVSACGKR